MITVSFDVIPDGIVHLFDVGGRVDLEKFAAEHTLAFDMTQHDGGIYFVVVRTAHELSVKRWSRNNGRITYEMLYAALEMILLPSVFAIQYSVFPFFLRIDSVFIPTIQ